ncbi:MAG: GatB/YqeY domain-containing protein [Candidatus Pacebacteria bacterium]|nr:GatB/YqeY domain-containing protein [Candidatus Paceibacterota bacterium]
MNLHEQIKNNIKEAMKSGDKIRLEVMRGLVTAFTNELVATNKTPQDLLDDDQALLVINRLAKQRKDSIEQFTKGGRMDLVEEETAQLIILEEYLPKLMEKDEVVKFVKEKVSELGITDSTKKGMLMSTLMKDLKGKADGAMVKEVVDGLVK